MVVKNMVDGIIQYTSGFEPRIGEIQGLSFVFGYDTILKILCLTPVSNNCCSPIIKAEIESVQTKSQVNIFG